MGQLNGNKGLKRVNSIGKSLKITISQSWVTIFGAKYHVFDIT